jgi:hypothetical protein
VSASEKLKALDRDMRAFRPPAPPEGQPDFLDLAVRYLNTLPSLLAVVEAAEAIQRNRVFLGDFPELDQAMAYLENELS